MKLHVTAWPKIDGVKRQPGDEVEVTDPGLARMLIRDGQARPAGTPEPLAAGPAASKRAAQVDAGLTVEPADGGALGDGDGAGGQKLAADPPPKPGRGASHADWIAYATGQGMPEEQAKAMTRSALTAHYAGS